MKAVLLTFLITASVQAREYVYKVLDQNFIDKENTEILVKENSPIKTQDGIGVCYGFSTTSLLESYRCREMNLDCSDPKEALSSFDVTSYYGEKQNGLREAGNTYPILKKLASLKPRSVAREECIPFTSLAHQVIDKKKATKRNEGKGWNYLIAKWNEYKGVNKKSNDCVSCLASDIKNTLGNLKTPADQIESAFRESADVEDFLYKSILPRECLEEKNKAVIPDFKLEAFPGNKEATPEEMEAKIAEILSQKIPLEIGICADDVYTPNCENQQGHSISLFGIKEVCHKLTKECRKVVKVKNSYGMGWQKKYNDGWIDLKEIVKSSLSMQNYHNITWITKP